MAAIEIMNATRVSQATVAAMEAALERRVSRTDLDASKRYVKVQGGVRTYVGRFVRAYSMGSGDGMTAHWEFDNNGTVTTETDQMWGSVSGAELAYFVEAAARDVPCHCGERRTSATCACNGGGSLQGGAGAQGGAAAQTRPPSPPMPALEPQAASVPRAARAAEAEPRISVVLPPLDIPYPAPGDFTWCGDAHTAYMLNDAWHAVNVNEAWAELAKGPESRAHGYMFSTPSALRKKVDDSLKYRGHSGASYGYTMRAMEGLARKVHWQRWVRALVHERAVAHAETEALAAERALKAYVGDDILAVATRAVVARLIAEKRRSDAVEDEATV